MIHPVFAPGRVAVVTGAALGIGLAACKRFAELGMAVCMADRAAEDLEEARQAVAGLSPEGEARVLALPTDVSKRDDLEALRETVLATFGEVGLLMNNAATRTGGDIWAPLDDWHEAMNVNFWGVINGVRTFLPHMMEQKAPSLVVNCGSKQGITNPPGNTAYNITKSALKSYTEALQHTLRNTEDCPVTAHLLVPGWTTTGRREHKPGAWLPNQVVDHLLAALDRGDFYIVCPDNEVTTEMDRKRILWSAGDITENRPPLSRWHPDYAEAFETFSP